MALIKRYYTEIREQMKPGDIIAFGGKGNFSEIIKWATRSTVSHVGVIIQSELRGIRDMGTDGYYNQIIESTSLEGRSGVIISRLSDRLNTYKGEMWWLPLAQEQRAKVDANLRKFYNWCLQQEYKPYDVPQAVKAGLDVLDRAFGGASPTLNQEDFSKFFCSELAAGALEEVGAIPRINASEVTPIDLCSFRIFQSDYVQVKGDIKEIRSYNSVDPQQWMQATGAFHAAA